MNKQKLVEASHRFYDFPEKFTHPDEGRELFCYDREEIQEMAKHKYDQIPVGGTHLSLCDRCAHDYVIHRSNYVDLHLLKEFEVPITDTKLDNVWEPGDSCYQSLGRIFLEDMSYELSSEDNWKKTLPLFMRTNGVYDPHCEIFSFTLLDCPTTIKAADLLTPDGWQEMSPTEPISDLYTTYEFYDPESSADMTTHLNNELLMLRLRT
jgi:hypothetical protein